MTDKLLEIFAETLDCNVSELHSGLDFHAHARWDSLAALTLVTAVEDEFGVVLSDSNLKSVNSIAALEALIQSLK